MNNTFKPINWMQGMSVSSAHFIATENYLLERLMNNSEALQSKFAYGLLPMNGKSDDDEGQMQLSVTGKGDGSRLTLYSYHGITQGGCLVNIDPSQAVSCVCDPSIEPVEDGWDVVLSVSPFERRPCGEPDMQEMPPRYPYVDPVYKLSIVERNLHFVNTYGPFDVVVGLLRMKDGDFKLDTNFIPPALAMSSDPRLRRNMEIFSKSISTIKNALDVIMGKAYSPSAQKSSVLEHTLDICKEMQRSLATMFFKWHSYGVSLSPYQVAETIAGMSNTILASFTFMSKADKDDMLKYFYEWNGIAPSAFEQVLDDAVSVGFSQNRIGQSMLAIKQMLSTLEDLLVNLSKLDYVGQHKESMVVSVTSASEETTQGKKSSWLL